MTEQWRVYLSEGKEWCGRPLYEAVLEEARKAGLAGATVFKGRLGFGERRRLRGPTALGLGEDLPVVIELVDSAKALRAFLPHLRAIAPRARVTATPVRLL